MSYFIFIILSLSSFHTFAMPSQIRSQGERVIMVDPSEHAWGAYDSSGYLIRSGYASSGANWCSDIGRPCRTHTGSYRIFMIGGPGCVSARFPIPTGGAPMPYCMYFNGNQALHGSPHLGGNISHGCVRMRTSDAAWLRFNFATIGTRVIILSY